MTNAADKNYRENQNTHFKFIFKSKHTFQVHFSPPKKRAVCLGGKMW